MTSIAAPSVAPHAGPSAGTPPTASTRDRLLDAAATLLYQEGVGVGVERLCRVAGVSKRSMYQLFDTKDALMAASLTRSGEQLIAQLVTPDASDTTPREAIMRVFERLEAQSGSPDYLGCPFVSTAVELKDLQHVAVAVAIDFKGRLTAYFADWLAKAGATSDAETAEAADALTAVFDGCAVRAVMKGGPLRGLSLRMAGAILDSYGI